jgi:hypothetical protein
VFEKVKYDYEAYVKAGETPKSLFCGMELLTEMHKMIDASSAGSTEVPEMGLQLLWNGSDDWGYFMLGENGAVMG